MIPTQRSKENVGENEASSKHCKVKVFPNKMSDVGNKQKSTTFRTS